VQSLRHFRLPNIDDVGRSLIVDGDVHPMAIGSRRELIWHARRRYTRHDFVRRSIQELDGSRRFNRAVDSALVWRNGQPMRVFANWDLANNFLPVQINYAERVARSIGDVELSGCDRVGGQTGSTRH